MELVHSRHDLPPSWDGVPVEWSTWSQDRTTIIHHAPPEQMACDQCGAVDEAMFSFGTRPPPDGATFSTTITKTTRSGHQYESRRDVPAWPVMDLVAARCRHCWHDVVTDQRTGERWDLEEEDYGPTGSTQTDTLF